MAVPLTVVAPPPAAGSRRPIQPAASAAEPCIERWLRPLRWAALTVWVAIPLVSLLVPSLAGRLVWTVAVASLPMFIVLVGYHRWRRFCPLAFFNQLPSVLRRPGTRRVSGWLETRYYYLTVGVFVACLWLRLVATNGDGMAIAVFFVLLTLVALGCGL